MINPRSTGKESEMSNPRADEAAKYFRVISNERDIMPHEEYVSLGGGLVYNFTRALELAKEYRRFCYNDQDIVERNKQAKEMVDRDCAYLLS